MTVTTDHRTGFVSYPDLVREMAADRPDQLVATFCWFDGSDADQGLGAVASAAGAQRSALTRSGLLRRAAGVAAALHRTTAAGPVAILCPQGPDFVVAFVGCLLAGRVSIPLHPREPGRPDARIVSAIGDADARTVLTTTAHRESTQDVLSGLAPAELLLVDTLGDGDPDAVDTPAPGPDDVAYLQYTSGSTREPAGVQVTHGNLMTGTRQLIGATGLGPGARFVSWLPFFHDMGLMFLFSALRSGATACYMAPRQFVERPGRWLGLLSTERATHAVTPNFGLEMCVTRVREADREGLDLGALTALVNGSEPIRKVTLDAFADGFAPHGFARRAHTPGYGLAEATLVVSCTRPEQMMVTRSFDRAALRSSRVVPLPDGHPDGTDLVGCGAVIDQEVRIADPQAHTELPPGQVGEIWTRGANVCAGYWQRPEVSAEMFDAGLAVPGGAAEHGWLRTEDLGFFHGGHLFIVARLKDLVIIDGQNHYPADAEATLKEAVPAATRTAAFAVDVGDRERLVLALELAATPDAGVRELKRSVRRAVAEAHGLNVHDVVFVAHGGIPRTTSGKVQRSECRRRYEDGTLPLLDAS